MEVSVFLLTGHLLLISVETACSNSSVPENNTDLNRNLYTELTERLLSIHSPIVPPNAGDPQIPVGINTTMFLESILDFDMKKQELFIFIWFVVDWIDASLSWDTSKYPVDSIFLSPDQIWFPDLAIFNSFVSRDIFIKQKLPLQIFSDGTIRWMPGGAISLECPVDIHYYPFDTQTCYVSLGPWTRNAKYLNGTSCRGVSKIGRHVDWELSEMSCQYALEYQDFYFWSFKYTFQFSRKGAVYAVNVLLPVLLVSALNCVVFALPVDCGEKMSVSLTTFLTLAVFMTLIQDSLPSVSTSVCYLNVYLAFQLLISALAIIVSAVVVACRHRKGSGGAAGNTTVLDEDETGKTPEKQSVDWQRVGVLLDRVSFPVFVALNVLSFVVFCISVAF